MNELDKISIAMEADAGTFSPLGLTYSGTNPTAQCIINEVLKWLKSINASKLILADEGSDIRVMSVKGVPISTLFNENERYFDSHHTNGDTMTIIDSHVMDLCTAVWAVTSYAFASIDIMLPR